MSERKTDMELFDLVAALANTADMMSPAVADHNLLVAYFTMRLCQELELPPEESRDTVVAAALHDLGAFSLSDRLDLLAFEDLYPGEHATAGFLLLRDFGPFSGAAPLIRHHHVPWEDGRGEARDGEAVRLGSHLIHLADRIAVQLPNDRSVLAELPQIANRLRDAAGSMFVPAQVEAALSLTAKDHVWLEATSGGAEEAIRRELAGQTLSLAGGDLRGFAKVISRLIDFKSEFTATHSSGVVATAVKLAELLGFSEADREKMEMAAYLHDLGKLAVPLEILEKPGQLSQDEWPVMRSHVFYTHRALQSAGVFAEVASWSALHHERLDGAGYPFRFSQGSIPLGARVIAAADVFTGITEDRPYRSGMAEAAARRILRSLADGGGLDGDVVGTLLENYDDLNGVREEGQSRAAEEFHAFQAALG